ncbi:Acetyltransferase (GNAT) family protein [compost metagenome]
MDFSIKEISYSDVLPIWENKLWPQRQDPIRPLSSMSLGGSYDMDIYKNAKPSFMGLFHDTKLVGVLSGHPSSGEHYRVRGLYVDEGYRRKGGAHRLFAAFQDLAFKEGHKVLWSYPKLEALPVYLKFGFHLHSSKQHDENHVYVFLNAVT